MGAAAVMALTAVLRQKLPWSSRRSEISSSRSYQVSWSSSTTRTSKSSTISAATHLQSSDPCFTSSSEEIPGDGVVPSPPTVPLVARSVVNRRLFDGGRGLFRFFRSKKVRSIVLLNLIGVVFASNIPIIKEIELAMDPALFNMVRFTTSVIPFLPFMWQAGGDIQTVSNGLELGCWVTLAYLAEALGLLTSEAGRAAFLSQFMIVVVPMIEGFLGATIPVLTWQGAVISVVGIALLESSGSPPCVGDVLNLLSAVFFGIHVLRTEHISKRTKKDKIFALLGYEMFVVALFSTIWFISFGSYGDYQQINSTSWQWMATVWDWIISFPWIPAIYTGIFSSSLCLWAEMSAMRDVSATETAIIYGLEPLWGACFAWFILGERWDITGWMGAALILVGSLTVQIFGSAPDETRKDQKNNSGIQHLNVKKPSDLSLPTVVIDSTTTKNARILPNKITVFLPSKGLKMEFIN